MTLRILAMAALALVTAGCSGNSDNPGSGGGGETAGAGGSGPDGGDRVALSGIRVTIDGLAHQGQGTVAVLRRMDQLFNSVGGSLSDGTTFAITWQGAATGTFTQAEGLIMVLINPSGQYVCGHGDGTSCSLLLTAYGPNVGDRVTCTFSGTLRRVMGMGAETVTVTAGAFDTGQ